MSFRFIGDDKGSENKHTGACSSQAALLASKVRLGGIGSRTVTSSDRSPSWRDTYDDAIQVIEKSNELARDTDDTLSKQSVMG
jgi:hypothetical protein